MEEPFNHSKTSLYTFLTLLLIFLVLNLKMIAPYMLAVLMGGILALLAQPLYRRVRDRHFKRQVSAALVTLAIIVLILGPLISIFSIALNQGIAIAQNLSQNGNFSFDFFLERISRWDPIQWILGDPNSAKRQIHEGIQSFGKTATTSILALAGSLPDKLLQLALTLITCYFFLVDGQRFLTWFSLRLPLDYDVRTRLFNSFKETAISVIWANMAAATAQASLMVFAFLILGVPGAFLAGVVTFIFAWIPIVGSFPVWTVGAIYLYVAEDSLIRVALMLAIGVVTGIVDNFIRPMILKGREDMHPLVSLIAIFGGISMFGIFGVFFGPIIAAALIALLQIWPVVGERFGLTFTEKVELPSPAAPTNQIQCG